MTKIWIKVINDLRITEDFIYEITASDSFFETVRKVCEKLDAPTPLILNTHRASLKKFNRCSFKKSDFVETVPFDELIIEDISQ